MADGPKTRRRSKPREPLLSLSRRRLLVPLRIRLQSQRAAINSAVDRVLDLAHKTGCLDENARAEVEIALREALANAIIHGNKGNVDKQVLLRCYCDTEHGLLIAVRDEGPGFDPEDVPDPRSAERLHLTHGRGIFLMRELMDAVEHRRGGREVLLYKKLMPAAKKPARSIAKSSRRRA